MQLAGVQPVSRFFRVLRIGLWRILSARFIRIIARLLLGLLAFSTFMVIVFKFVPPYRTPLMLSRSIGAMINGQDRHIKYEWTPYEEISREAAIAVVASEDQNFPKHWGFDFGEIKKVLAQSKTGKRTRGASTISQQVAKNVFLWNGRSFLRKGLEVYFTVLIELVWGKERILEVYLNVAEMGDMTFGVQAASQHYFKKPASEITRKQAALLAAVLPNPRRFSVKKPSRYVRGRANFITQQIRLLGGVSYLNDLRSF